MSLGELAPALGAGGAVLAAILGILKFFEERREKRAMVREAFASVVRSLAEENEVQRSAAAILLRRFLDPRTEVGRRNTPFADDAVSVIASLLCSQETGSFQKLLADGLAYAPSLVGADLQKTNLQKAYLGSRKLGHGGDAQVSRVDLSGADFYRADLSGASLKGAKATGAQFYQARALDTVFKDADLRNANFFGANLRGARLDRALLDGASFQDARNLPAGLAEGLDAQGRYNGAEPFEPPKVAPDARAVRVFVSRPGAMSDHHRQLVATVSGRLQAEGLVPVVLERSEYPAFGAVAEVQRLIAACAGALVLGLRDIEVRDAVCRVGTSDQRRLAGNAYATPWSQIEAGMALMMGLPVLVIAEADVEGGVFDLAGSEHNLFRLRFDEDLGSSVFTEWSAAVRERATVI